MTTVYVDADACPVKDEIITIAIRHGSRAVMVCNCLLYTSDAADDP